MIGITADYHEKRHRVSSGYTNAIVSAGGIPIILPNIVDLVPHFMNLCDGFVFTGGDDPIMQEWGIETHHNAEPVQQSRQTFELTLLRHVQQHPEKSVLGVCLGMQWMGLIAGGTLNQDLAEPFASNHKKNDHIISGAIGEGTVHSHHHQAMESVGELEVVATSDDGIIEAIQDPNRLWYKGVQWHPERTANKKLGQRLFDQMVLACKKT